MTDFSIEAKQYEEMTIKSMDLMKLWWSGGTHKPTITISEHNITIDGSVESVEISSLIDKHFPNLMDFRVHEKVIKSLLWRDHANGKIVVKVYNFETEHEGTDSENRTVTHVLFQHMYSKNEEDKEPVLLAEFEEYCHGITPHIKVTRSFSSPDELGWEI